MAVVHKKVVHKKIKDGSGNDIVTGMIDDLYSSIFVIT